ncbi:hypothetical protein [Rivularia sp. UHCC 0363]|uniref:hypothetical protein n=1 Tax=Rivularia sp. UHCC 0363 TaxID=3110244 RepID=UPI002B2076C5|nr:hypothetical protein [Rivularia sp. UHCC 0363]MEA5593968.1 hypothetical protein [Rivularia sp. UHCC 0363]
MSIDTQKRLDKFIESVEAAQKLQNDIVRYGLEAAYLYAEDVDGDWLERWDEDELTQTNFVESVTTFLESDDWVAVSVRKQSQGKSLQEIATQLEDCLRLSEAENRVFAIKTMLVESASCRNNRSFGSDDTVDLLDLAEHLVQRLEIIFQISR